MSSTTENVRRGPDPERRAVGEQTLERTETGRAAPNVGGAQPNCGSSRSIPHDDRSSGRTPSTDWWRHASRDRTHRSARDWQRYVVGKVLLSSETARDPGAGAGGIAIKDRGNSCRRARCLFDHRTWRAAEERSVRNHRLQPPTLRVGSGCNSVNTKCVRDCVRRFWSSGRCSSGNRHRTPTRQGTSNGCPLHGARCGEVT
jgi:hypothetical protein